MSKTGKAGMGRLLKMPHTDLILLDPNFAGPDFAESRRAAASQKPAGDAEESGIGIHDPIAPDLQV